MIGLQPLYVIISGETENVGDENTAQGRMGGKCGKGDVWLKRCLFSYINKKCFVPHMRKRLSIQGADYTKRHKSYDFSVSSSCYNCYCSLRQRSTKRCRCAAVGRCDDSVTGRRVFRLLLLLLLLLSRVVSDGVVVVVRCAVAVEQSYTFRRTAK